MRRTVAIIAAAILLSLPINAAMGLTLQEVQKAIKDEGANWIAGETSVSRMSPEDRASLFGVTIPMMSYVVPPEPAAPWKGPATWDWRNMDGKDFTTPVKNQAACGSCSAFAGVSVLEAAFKIARQDPAIMPDLSEQAAFSCAGANCNSGDVPWDTFGTLTSYGAPDESCFPYQSGHGATIACTQMCSDWAVRTVRLTSFTHVDVTVDAIKQAIALGPVYAGFLAYNDLQYYTGGIYKHTGTDMPVGHAVTLIGWDDSQGCWIVKNSWGTKWGENGYFRIAWGDSAINYMVFSIVVETSRACEANSPPDLVGLYYSSHGDTQPKMIGENDDVVAWLDYKDANCNLYSGQIWYRVDGANFTQMGALPVDLRCAAQGGYLQVNIPNTYALGVHNFDIKVVDQCGAESNLASGQFKVVNGSGGDDDSSGTSGGGSSGGGKSGGCGS